MSAALISVAMSVIAVLLYLYHRDARNRTPQQWIGCCPACKGRTSYSASTCPHCGHRLVKRSVAVYVMLAICLLVFAWIVGIVYA